MGALWSDETRYGGWLRIELAVCEAWAARGRIPTDALERIRARARVEVRRIHEIEATVRHDVIAFLASLEESIGADSRFVHIGLTSSDVVDTALALTLVAAADHLLREVDRLRATLAGLARRHRDVLMVGRTHGIHAEPTTFGLKVAGWYSEAGRSRDRLARAREVVRVGKLSGAVGTFAHVPPEVEAEVCARLGLVAEPVSTQVVPRDRHAEFVAQCAVVAASLERIATEIRSLQRTEILELEEPFVEGQKGSSAMPHKKNPVSCEQVVGLARVVRAHAGAALEDVALWHERDITHSSVERIVLPDATVLLDYLIAQVDRILEGLVVRPDRMRENLDRSYGLVYSQRVLLALTDAGLPRQAAYEMVQRNALRAWEERRPFLGCLEADPEVAGRIPAHSLRACFDPAWFLRHVATVFQRLDLA
jgi:adenylosuccinate lyase